MDFYQIDETNYVIKHIKFSKTEIPKFPELTSDTPIFEDIIINHFKSFPVNPTTSSKNLLYLDESLYTPIVDTEDTLDDSVHFEMLSPVDIIESGHNTNKKLDACSWVDLLEKISEQNQGLKNNKNPILVKNVLGESVPVLVRAHFLFISSKGCNKNVGKNGQYDQLIFRANLEKHKINQ